MTNEQLLARLNLERQAVKAYDAKPLPEAIWAVLKDTLANAPSAFKLKPYRVIAIERSQNQALIAKIQAAAWNQTHLGEAAKVLIFVVPARSVFTAPASIQASLQHLSPSANSIALVQQEQLISNYLAKEEPWSDQWAMKQCYEAIGYLTIAATLLGVGSTPMEGFDRPFLNEVLRNHQLISNVEQAALICLLGYPASAAAYAHKGSKKRIRDPFNVKFKTL